MDTFIVSLLVAGMVFSLVFLILYSVNQNRLRVLKRLNKLTADQKKESVVKNKRKENQERRVDNTKIKILRKLADELSLSGILIRPSEFLTAWVFLAFAPSSVFLLISGNYIVALGALIIGAFLPPFFIHIKKVKRIELFEQQLTDALGIICNSLKAGLTFQQALVSISNEMPDPISREFARVVKEVKLGNTIEKSLTNLSERIKSQNFMLIVSAILIQRQIGGNLSDILANIAGTIKERFKIKNEIKVLTTTGRTSGMVVGFMPIVILLLFMLINPGYVKSFFDTSLGIQLLIAAVVLEVIGFTFIRKIVNIKF